MSLSLSLSLSLSIRVYVCRKKGCLRRRTWANLCHYCVYKDVFPCTYAHTGAYIMVPLCSVLPQAALLCETKKNVMSCFCTRKIKCAKRQIFWSTSVTWRYACIWHSFKKTGLCALFRSHLLQRAKLPRPEILRTRDLAKNVRPKKAALGFGWLFLWCALALVLLVHFQDLWLSVKIKNWVHTRDACSTKVLVLCFAACCVA